MYRHIFNLLKLKIIPNRCHSKHSLMFYEHKYSEVDQMVLASGSREEKKRNKDGNASAIPAYQRGANQRRCCQRNGNLTPLDGKSLSTLALSARHHPHHPATHNMMRQQLLRSLPRSQRLASINATRAFTSSAPRPAEVELTIGTPVHQQAPTTLFDGN